MRALFLVLAFGLTLAGHAAQAADSRPITIPGDRNCRAKCEKTLKICISDGKAAGDCKRVNNACSRACSRR